jgi:ABC-type multidrug transport system fused ATPase/permease subunit
MIGQLLWILRTAPHRRRNQFLLLSLLIVVSGGMELAALGSLALFVTSLTSLESIMRSEAVMRTARLLEPELLNDPKLFYLALGSLTMLLVVLKNLCVALHNYATARFSGALNHDYGTMMLRGYLSMPYEWCARSNAATVLQTMGWRDYVSLFVSMLMTVFSDLVVVLLLFLSMFLFHPLLTTAVLLGLGVVGLGSFALFKARIHALASTGAELMIDMSAVVLKSVQGCKDMKLFNRSAAALSLYMDRMHLYVRSQASQRVCERGPVWLLETAVLGALILGSVLMIQAGGATSAQVMGTLAVLAVSAWRVLPALYRSVTALGSMRGFLPCLQRVRDFIDEVEREGSRQRALPLETVPPLTREIRLEGLRFRYEGNEAETLAGVDLAVGMGQCIGIIGQSGAGKSTLTDLLTGLLEPSGGHILVDGRPIVPASRESWRSQIGFVPQKPFLFDGTLAENVAFALTPEAVDRSAVERSCAQAGVNEFLADLPLGLDTVIGDQGGLLSGGQAQRVAIARALYRNPRVLVFDEATSSLDDKNERYVMDSLTAVRGGKAVIIIAHHLRTVENCDTVFWLEDGKVVLSGTPTEVLPIYTSGGERT